MSKESKKLVQPKNLHTISLYVANKPGVLVRIALVFARRGYNIDSLVVSPSVDPRFSRMTITAKGDLQTLDQIVKQTFKLVDVVHASEHMPEDAIIKEMALLKIKHKPATKTAISKLLKRFHADIVDQTDTTIVVEQIGSSEELDEFENLVKKYGIIEMIRTGKLVMARGKEPT